MVASLFGRSGSALIGLAALLIADRGLIIDRARIVFGDPDGAVDRVAVIDAAKVRSRTAAWQALESEKIPAEDPRRARLMEEAEQAVREAAAKVADADGYDLIGEVGSIIIRGRSVPEITSRVIAALGERPGGATSRRR